MSLVKKKRPIDATLRNVRAAKTRNAALKTDVVQLKRDVKVLQGQVTAIWRVLERLVAVPARRR